MLPLGPGGRLHRRPGGPAIWPSRHARRARAGREHAHEPRPCDRRSARPGRRRTASHPFTATGQRQPDQHRRHPQDLPARPPRRLPADPSAGLPRSRSGVRPLLPVAGQRGRRIHRRAGRRPRRADGQHRRLQRPAPGEPTALADSVATEFWTFSSAHVARRWLERAVGEIEYDYSPATLAGQTGTAHEPYRAAEWRAILALMARRYCTGTKAAHRLYAACNSR